MTEGGGLTEKQAATLLELEAKARGKGVTDIQRKTLEGLIEKRDNPELAEGVKTHLIDVFASQYYGRKEEINNKFLNKGNAREEDSVTVVSRLTKTLFVKNDKRLRNAYIQGEPDMFIGESIDTAQHTVDTKTSWSLHTFLRSKYKKLDPLYYWQGVGYMDLTGAQSHTVAFCLVNGLPEVIMKEKKDLAFRIKETDLTSDAFKNKCKQIEINHIFDIEAFIKECPNFPFDNDIDSWRFDIPLKERMHVVKFRRNEADIRKMHDRVLQCREHLEKTFYNLIFA
jgi:hypothetical protein